MAFEDEGFGVEPVEADERHAGGVEEDFAAFEIGAAAVEALPVRPAAL